MTGEVFFALVGDRLVWASAGKDGLAVCPGNSVFKVELAQRNRVGQREEDGALVEHCHRLNNLAVKGPLGRAETKQSSRLDIFDNVNKVLQLRAVRPSEDCGV